MIHDKTTCANYRRAMWAAETMLGYNELVGGGKNDPETQIADLLADLRHLCDLEALDWSDIDRHAYHHYASESHHTDEACNQTI